MTEHVRETITGVWVGTLCHRGGGHINTDGACGTKGPAIYVEVDEDDSPADIADFVEKFRASAEPDHPEDWFK